MNTHESVLKDIADIIRSTVGENTGFMLFIGTDAGTDYIGKIDRADAVKVLEEWLTKTSGKLTKSIKESSCAIDSRLALERQCAKLGEPIASITQVLLFLFDYGTNGSLAYFTNMELAREGVAAWVRSQKERS